MMPAPSACLHRSDGQRRVPWTPCFMRLQHYPSNMAEFINRAVGVLTDLQAKGPPKPASEPPQPRLIDENATLLVVRGRGCVGAQGAASLCLGRELSSLVATCGAGHVQRPAADELPAQLCAALFQPPRRDLFGVCQPEDVRQAGVCGGGAPAVLLPHGAVPHQPLQVGPVRWRGGTHCPGCFVSFRFVACCRQPGMAAWHSRQVTG